MAETIRIKKGVSLRLLGEAKESFLQPAEKGDLFALVPEDFPGLVPKLTVKVGDRVNAGDPLFYHKKYPEMKFVSPVGGEVVDVVRGSKRRILSVRVKNLSEGTADIPSQESQNCRILKPSTSSAEEIKSYLLANGLWPFMRQRPYDIVAEPNCIPRDIYVTAHFTAPLAPRFGYLLEKSENRRYLQTALEALTKLTPGNVYLGVEEPIALAVDRVKQYITKGPHPAGTVGVLINRTYPINKGEVVWTLKATDLLVIGRYMETGIPDFSRDIAITGSEVKDPGYMTIIPGCDLAKVLGSRIFPQQDNCTLRLINGNVFTGVKIDEDRPFSSLDIDQITLIPEGNDVHEVLGWIAPRFHEFSISRTYVSWLFKKKRYRLDARLKGGERHMIMSDEFSRVFPLDIMPEPLLKAIIAFNIDKMEDLGIYEVAPEDFAVCEFVDSSKEPLQEIVRKGLDLLYKEMN